MRTALSQAPRTGGMPRALSSFDRRTLEALVEEILAALDTLAGDCDLEDDDPDFGADDIGEPQSLPSKD